MPAASARRPSRFRPGAGLLAGLAAAVLLAGVSARPARAYTPGSGSLYTANFEAELDADWELGSGILQPSPWTRVADGGDTSLYADGRGPYGSSPTQHWARHHVVPATATSFSIAFEYRTELGAAYYFDLDLEQRAPTPRKYRMRVDSAGIVSLWRTENGAWVQKAATGAAVVPLNQKRWFRVAILPGAEHPLVRVRVWSGSAGSEPATWTLGFTDELDTLERVHRFELTTDGPKGNETWIDDLDAFGDASEGVASTVRTIYITEWSHLDIGFTEPPDDIETFSKTHLDQVLANLAADPSYRFMIEESWYLARWWERSTEAERDDMVHWLRSGRLSLGAGYASLHTTTAGHEELTRNLYWASRFAREHQVPLRTWITDDVPGSTFALPELLARSGIEYFLAGMNTPFGGKVQHPHHGERPFWWVGPDGSRVLTWHTMDAYAEAFDWGFSFFDGIDDIRNKTGRKLPELEELGYPYPELMLMRAFDNHYQGFKVRDLVNQWNATYQTPKFELATPEQFLDMMLARYGAEAFPSFSGDFGAAWSGSHAGAPHTERMVRQAHREARAAEALLAAASVVDGLPVPQADAEHAYRRMLEVDEHSGAGGWPGYFTPEEMDRNNRIHLSYAVEASDTAASLLEQGLDRFTASVPAAGDAVIVTNPLGRARDGWAQVALPAALYGTAFRVVDRVTGEELPYQRFDAAVGDRVPRARAARRRLPRLRPGPGRADGDPLRPAAGHRDDAGERLLPARRQPGGRLPDGPRREGDRTPVDRPRDDLPLQPPRLERHRRGPGRPGAGAERGGRRERGDPQRRPARGRAAGDAHRDAAHLERLPAPARRGPGRVRQRDQPRPGALRQRRHRLPVVHGDAALQPPRPLDPQRDDDPLPALPAGRLPARQLLRLAQRRAHAGAVRRERRRALCARQRGRAPPGEVQAAHAADAVARHRAAPAAPSRPLRRVRVLGRHDRLLRDGAGHRRRSSAMRTTCAACRQHLIRSPPAASASRR